MVRDRAYRRYMNEIKTIRNFKVRYYIWRYGPNCNIDENDVDLLWFNSINSYMWYKSKQKTESIKYKYLWDTGKSPYKKYYRPKVKKLMNDEIKRFYNKIY